MVSANAENVPTPPIADGRRSKVGAPRGNLNAARDGLAITRLCLGTLPAAWANIGRVCADLRRALEDAVVERRGKVTLSDAFTIQTACKWERHGMLATKWLRDNPEMPPRERLDFSREIAKASEARDRAVKALEVDPRDVDPWEEMWRAQVGLDEGPDPGVLVANAATATPQAEATIADPPTDREGVNALPQAQAEVNGCG